VSGKWRRRRRRRRREREREREREFIIDNHRMNVGR
jgi:hypothetical protein